MHCFQIKQVKIASNQKEHTFSDMNRINITRMINTAMSTPPPKNILTGIEVSSARFLG